MVVHTVNILKIGQTKNCCKPPGICTVWFCNSQIFLNNAGGMVNNKDPD